MIRTILGLTFILALLAWAGTQDLEHELQQQAHHCAQVALWEAEAAAGIGADDRAGWPNYNDTNCNDNQGE